MPDCKNMYDYTIIGSLHSDEKIEVLIAFKGENTPDNLYILNKIPFNRENIELFKKFFFCFNSKDRIEDFEDLFVYDRNFYVIFKYKNCESIKIRFAKSVCVNVFDDRCSFLEKILIKMDRLSNFPLNAFLCITDPDNICIDEDNKLRICYNFGNMFKKENSVMEDVYKNIGSIIFTLLQQEAEVKYNKALHVVLQRCSSGLYSSIPELVVDLKTAEKTSKNTGLLSYIKYRIGLRKNIISKIVKGATVTAVVLGLVYLGYNRLFQNTVSSSTAPVVAIGDVQYNGDSQDESDKEVSTETKKTENKTQGSTISLSPGLDIEYEDYIVQYGDTISSICESYYKDSSLENAVATFNDLEINDKLVAGSILKLPNKTAIALYTSN